jgi:thioredoxin 1
LGRRAFIPPSSSRTAAENSRRLGRPSESGRLPLPEELGIVPEDQSALPELTDAGFEREVLRASVPYLVDFWAETCVPCKLQEPAIRRLARDLNGRIRVGRLNVFDHPTTPDRLRIRGVPHLVVFVGGEVAMEMVGSHSYEQLRDKLRRLGIE